MKGTLIIAFVLIIGLCLSGCGGGDSNDLFTPREISKEHQGLSLNQLESMASDISYDELSGHPGKGIFFDRNNPRIKDNIEKHTDTLLHYIGQVETIYPSEDKSRFSLWVCPKYHDKPDESSETGSESAVTDYDCSESVFLLYDPTRGPGLSAGDVIEFSGILTSSARKEVITDRSWSKSKFFTYHPTISVIKAKIYTE